MRSFLLGTDWWTDCDDAVAVRLLVRAAMKKEIKLLGIAVDACMEHSIASLDAFLHQEKMTQEIPLGLDRDAVDFEGTPRYQYRLANLGTRTNPDAEDAVQLYRRVLEMAEEPVEIIEIGFPQVLANLLQSEGGQDLFCQKVKKVWMMAGKWDEQGGREHNFCNNRRSAQGAETFCRLCPVPVTFLGWEIGHDVITGDELSPEDPLYHLMCDHGSPNGRMSWDPMLVLMAIAGDETDAGYRCVRGWASVCAQDGANSFVQDDHGLHRFVIKDRENAFYSSWINRLIASE